MPSDTSLSGMYFGVGGTAFELVRSSQVMRSQDRAKQHQDNYHWNRFIEEGIHSRHTLDKQKTTIF